MKNLPIIETILLLAVSGLVLYVGKLTLDKWDSEEWGLMALGVFATLGFFSLMVALVKGLIEHKNSANDDLE